MIPWLLWNSRLLDSHGLQGITKASRQSKFCLGFLHFLGSMNVVHMGFKLMFIDEDILAELTRMLVFLTVVTLKGFVSIE